MDREMGGIASAIIIPPTGSGLDRLDPGFRGAEAFRRVTAVPAIAPRRENAPQRQAGVYPDDGTHNRGRDNREVRQLAIRPDYQSGADLPSGRTVAVGPGKGRAGLPDFGGARFASIQFLAQVLGQAEGPSSGPLAYHPDGATLGNDAYRRAGAAPPHYSEQPTVFRVAI
jgi:hypothetical protein